MAKEKKATNGQIVVPFEFERETKGAVRFMEVSEAGFPVDMAAAKIGTLYVRKSAFAGGQFPQYMTVTISTEA